MTASAAPNFANAAPRPIVCDSSENAFSARLIDYLGKPTTAGTDAHAIKDIGRCATKFDVRIETLEDLIEALRAGKCRAVDLVKAST